MVLVPGPVVKVVLCEVTAFPDVSVTPEMEMVMGIVQQMRHPQRSLILGTSSFWILRVWHDRRTRNLRVIKAGRSPDSVPGPHFHPSLREDHN